MVSMEYSVAILIGAGIIGFVVGSLTGIFGVGGGFLLTPALMIILCVPGPVAVGTGLATIVVNSLLGLIKRKDSNTIDCKLAIMIAIGSVIGVLIGSQTMESLKKISKIIIFGKEQSPVQYMLLCLFLVMFSIVAGYLYFDYKKNHKKTLDKRIGLFAKIKLPPYINFTSLEEPKLSIVILLFFGLLIAHRTNICSSLKLCFQYTV